MGLLQGWRWFGPQDTVPLAHAKQAGATSIVSALHHIPCGVVWPADAIKSHRLLIETEGLTWDVVESVPVHEAIKTGSHNRDTYITNYIDTLSNLAACGIKTVCYNFMPILDWTRTDINYAVQDGSKALRFSYVDYVAFDVHILQRKGAASQHPSWALDAANLMHKTATADTLKAVSDTILLGLPGTVDNLDLAGFNDQLGTYKGIDHEKLRANYAYFLNKVVPVAEALGMVLTVHPDDPPFDIFGLPRVVSNEADLNWVTNVVPSKANQICFCAGSLSAKFGEDLPGIITRLGHKIGFVHLRSVQLEPDGLSFYEANHLEGSAPMYNIMRALVVLQRQRDNSGLSKLVFRPDHGHQMLDDIGKKTYFGYSAIGRLRGLAELRELEMGVEMSM